MIDVCDKWDLKIKNHRQAKMVFANNDNNDKLDIFKVIVNKYIITASSILANSKNDQNYNEYIKVFENFVLVEFNYNNLIAVLNCNNEEICNSFIDKYSNMFFNENKAFFEYIDKIDNDELDTLNDIIVIYAYLKYCRMKEIAPILKKYNSSDSITVRSKQYLYNFIDIILTNKDYNSLILLLNYTKCFNLVYEKISKDNLKSLLIKYGKNIEPKFVFEMIYGVNFDDNTNINYYKTWLNYIEHSVKDKDNIKYFINKIDTIIKMSKIDIKVLDYDNIKKHIKTASDYYNKNKLELLNNDIYKKEISTKLFNLFLFDDYTLTLKLFLDKLWFLQTYELYDNEYILDNINPDLVKDKIKGFFESEIIEKKLDEIPEENHNDKEELRTKYILIYLDTFVGLFIDFDEYISIINKHISNKINLSKGYDYKYVKGVLYYENGDLYLLRNSFKIKLKNNRRSYNYYNVGATYNIGLLAYSNNLLEFDSKGTKIIDESQLKYDFSSFNNYLGNEELLKENFQSINQINFLDYSLRGTNHFKKYMNFYIKNIEMFKKTANYDMIEKLLKSRLEYLSLSSNSSTSIIIYDYYLNKDSNEKFSLSIKLINCILEDLQKRKSKNYFLSVDSSDKMCKIDSKIRKLYEKLKTLKELDNQYYVDLINILREKNLLSLVYCDENIEKDYFDFINDNEVLKDFYSFLKEYLFNEKTNIEKNKDDKLLLLIYIFTNLNSNLDDNLDLIINLNFEIVLDNNILDFINNVYDIFYMRLECMSDVKKLIFFDIGSKELLNSKINQDIYNKYSFIRKQIVTDDINIRNFKRELMKLRINNLFDISSLDKFIDNNDLSISLDVQKELQIFLFYYKTGESYDISKIYLIMKKICKFNYYNIEYHNDIIDIQLPTEIFNIKKIDIKKMFNDLISSNLTLEEKIDFYFNSILKCPIETSFSKFLSKLNSSDNEINKVLKKYNLPSKIQCKTRLNKYILIINDFKNSSTPFFSYGRISEYNNFLKEYRFLLDKDEFLVQIKWDSSRISQKNDGRIYFVVKNPLFIIDDIYNIAISTLDINPNEKIYVIEQFYNVLKNNKIDLNIFNEIDKIKIDEFLIRLDLPFAYKLNIRNDLKHYVRIITSIENDYYKQADVLYVYLKENNEEKVFNILKKSIYNRNGQEIINKIQELLYKNDDKEEFNLLIEIMHNLDILEDKYINQHYIDYIKKYTNYSKYISGKIYN